MIGVSKAIGPHPLLLRDVLKDASIVIPPALAIEIDAADPTERSLILRLIYGSVKPDRGRILKEGTLVSPILNDGGAAGPLLAPTLTVRENIRFQSSLSHAPYKLLLDFVVAACECEAQLEKPANSLKWPLKRAVEACLFAALPYDFYLVDQLETIPNFAQLQLYAGARGRGAGLIFTTGQSRLAAEVRDLTLLIRDGAASFVRTSSAIASAGGK
jgi:capsular polysaccharide transport system ATP-binding protein